MASARFGAQTGIYVRERMMGFEPTTSTLARLRSTTELHPHSSPVVYQLRNEGGLIIRKSTQDASLFLIFFEIGVVSRICF